MFLQFFVGFYDGNGTYVDSLRTVAYRYACSTCTGVMYLNRRSLATPSLLLVCRGYSLYEVATHYTKCLP